MTELSLSSRYAAAWAEHGVRVTQRQAVMNLYMTIIPIMFGAFISSKSSEFLPALLIGVTLFTLACSAMVLAHHQVMQNLQHFMRNCERYAAADITNQANGQRDLFYFANPDNPTGKRLHPFHGSQRMLQRRVFAAIFLFVGAGVCVLPFLYLSKNTAWLLVAPCAPLLLVSACVLPFWDLSIKWSESHDMDRAQPSS
jgi:putative effector of murein hydrolase LrgA (UPF0299 family)